MSDKYLLAIRTMTEEQYNTYFKNLPIPYSVIKSNPQQFIETMSNNNDVLKKLLKNCWKNIERKHRLLKRIEEPDK